MLSRVSPNGASNHGLQQTRVRCFLGILAFPIENFNFDARVTTHIASSSFIDDWRTVLVLSVRVSLMCLSPLDQMNHFDLLQKKLEM